MVASLFRAGKVKIDELLKHAVLHSVNEILFFQFFAELCHFLHVAAYVIGDPAIRMRARTSFLHSVPPCRKSKRKLTKPQRSFAGGFGRQLPDEGPGDFGGLAVVIVDEEAGAGFGFDFDG